jgi:hypothetical protein
LDQSKRADCCDQSNFSSVQSKEGGPLHGLPLLTSVADVATCVAIAGGMCSKHKPSDNDKVFRSLWWRSSDQSNFSSVQSKEGGPLHGLSLLTWAAGDTSVFAKGGTCIEPKESERIVFCGLCNRSCDQSNFSCVQSKESGPLRGLPPFTSATAISLAVARGTTCTKPKVSEKDFVFRSPFPHSCDQSNLSLVQSKEGGLTRLTGVKDDIATFAVAGGGECMVPKESEKVVGSRLPHCCDQSNL